MRDITIAAVTCEAPVGEIDRNLAATIEWTRRAKAAGADLVCFPELNITGYCNRAEMAEIALPVPGRVSQKLSKLSTDENIIVLAGMAEKNPQGMPYASHGVFTPDGDVRIYRKVHTAPPEKKTYAPGESIPVFKTQETTFGIQLCFDAHFPELSSAMTSQGAEILFFPHASPRGNAQEKHRSWMRHLTARAFDNSVFVVACNQIGDNCNGLRFPGNAMVIGPSGELIAKDISPQASMLITELKAAELEAVRSHPMRHFFPHRRPGLYK